MRRGLPAIMHGDGSYVRSWLHTEDTVDALLAIIESGEHNRIYNVGSETELQNIEGPAEHRQDSRRAQGEGLGLPLRTVRDRTTRYSLDDAAVRKLGWKPRRNFHEELESIVRTPRFHPIWLKARSRRRTLKYGIQIHECRDPAVRREKSMT